MVTIKLIEDFISNKEIAVIGTSTNKKKFGFIIFDSLRKNHFTPFPINPNAAEIDGVKCYADVASLPASVKAVIFVTKPDVTDKIAADIKDNKNIEYLWFQPGSTNKTTIETVKTYGKNIIYGECILMFLKSSGFPHSMHRFFKKMFGSFPK